MSLYGLTPSNTMARTTRYIPFKLTAVPLCKRFVYLISLSNGTPLYVGATKRGLLRVRFHFLPSTWRIFNLNVYKQIKASFDAGEKFCVTVLEEVAENVTLGSREKFWTGLLQNSGSLANEKHGSSPSAEMLARRPKRTEFSDNRKRAVQCIETGAKYESVRACARELGLFAPNVSAVCKGKLRSTGRLSFNYLEKR